MNKKQAYKLINYLLDEAYGLLNFSDSTDIKAVSNLLATANYLLKSYQLKEHEEILQKIRKLRTDAFKCIEIMTDSLDNIFM